MLSLILVCLSSSILSTGLYKNMLSNTNKIIKFMTKAINSGRLIPIPSISIRLILIARFHAAIESIKAPMINAVTIRPANIIAPIITAPIMKPKEAGRLPFSINCSSITGCLYHDG